MSKIGYDSLWAEWIGALAPLVLFHTFGFIKAKCNREYYLEWEKSIYVIEVTDEEAFGAEPEYYFSIDRFLWMISRGLVQLGI